MLNRYDMFGYQKQAAGKGKLWTKGNYICYRDLKKNHMSNLY